MVRHILALLIFTSLCCVPGGVMPGSGRAAADEPWVKGIFCLVPPRGPLPEPSSSNFDLVMALTVYFYWRDIEPRRGDYAWEKIDAALKHAERYGKRVSLGIAPGIGTPGWVYEAGVRRFNFVSKLRYPPAAAEEASVPVPWDPTFLQLWSEFVKALGIRYATSRTIALIQMGGANWHTLEMFLPRQEGRDITAWMQAGYSNAVLIQTWEKIIDTYATAFPQTAIDLHLGVPVDRSSRQAVETIVAYGVKKYGRRFAMQYDSLSDKPTMGSIEAINGYFYDIIRRYSAQATTGFQTKIQRLRGDLATALEWASKAGAHFVELHRGECEARENRALLQQFLQTLERR